MNHATISYVKGLRRRFFAACLKNRDVISDPYSTCKSITSSPNICFSRSQAHAALSKRFEPATAAKIEVDRTLEFKPFSVPFEGLYDEIPSCCDGAYLSALECRSSAAQ